MPLICHITWTQIETFFQHDYAREEVFNPVGHSSDSLEMRSPKENSEQETLSEPRDWHNGQGWLPGRL